MAPEWAGSHPFYLLIEHEEEGSPVTTGIDLDFPRWATLNAELMRKTGTWFLVAKQTDRPVLAVRVYEGEQPYYVARHVGTIGSQVGQEYNLGETMVTCYGIGKKQLDGTTQRLWYLPNGMVVGGEDAEVFALRLLRGY